MYLTDGANVTKISESSITLVRFVSLQQQEKYLKKTIVKFSWFIDTMHTIGRSV